MPVRENRYIDQKLKGGANPFSKDTRYLSPLSVSISEIAS